MSALFSSVVIDTPPCCAEAFRRISQHPSWTFGAPATMTTVPICGI
jgi:hypothetical protein